MTKPVGRAYRKPGRPLKLPPEDAGKRIEVLAAGGFGLLGVARAFGTTRETLHRWFDEDPMLKESFERGRELERQVLHNLLVKQAKKGNVVAAFFLLKTRHGYREGDQTDSGNRLQITFSLPGAMSMEDFKVITTHATTDDRDKPVSKPRPPFARGT